MPEELHWPNGPIVYSHENRIPVVMLETGNVSSEGEILRDRSLQMRCNGEAFVMLSGNSGIWVGLSVNDVLK